LSVKTSSYKVFQLVYSWKVVHISESVLTANLTRSDDLPTPEFPIKSTLKR